MTAGATHRPNTVPVVLGKAKSVAFQNRQLHEAGKSVPEKPRTLGLTTCNLRPRVVETDGQHATDTGNNIAPGYKIPISVQSFHMSHAAANHSSLPLGVGVYSIVDAARFIGADSRELRRWTMGYSFRTRKGDTSISAPLWTPDLVEYGIDGGLSFRDLLELRVVRAFRDRGVSLPAIRAAIAFARDELTTDRPFQCRRFQTDGFRIFATVRESTGDETLVEVTRRQQTFREIVGPSLFAGVEFNSAEDAVRWYPGRRKTVVLDPTRNFGHPIVNSSGVPTAAIADAVRAEGGNVGLVARLFELAARDVQHAVAFEESITRH